MSGSSSFFVEETGMGESSERPDLVDSDSEGNETNDKASSGEAHAQLLIQKLY